MLLLYGLACATPAQSRYLGFDRNYYPGDDALAALRKTFDYTSYWLNAPPEAKANTWTGKRALLKQYGFGFLVLFNGRLEDKLGPDAKAAGAMGRADGKAAVAAAAREGFAPGVLIFLDQEEGGRMTGPQLAYVFGWIEAVRAAGDRAGVYCSAVTVRDESGLISTARHIADEEAARTEKELGHKTATRLALWIADDQCPPSPGCTVEKPKAFPEFSRDPNVWVPVWQYAQSPRRQQFSAGCPKNTTPDGMCNAPGLTPGPNSFVDLNLAESADPSETP
jgi:hypothetical protein